MLYVQEEVIIIHPNTVASHDTCKGLRKRCGIVNVIWYSGSSSSSGLSTSFIGPSAPWFSYTVNKNKSMTVNTLFITNLFLIVTNTTKGNTCFEKGCTRCVNQARKMLRIYPTNWTSWMGIRTQASTSWISSTSTFTWSLGKGTLWMIVDPSWTLPRATRLEGLSSIYNSHFFESPVSGSYLEGSTQLPFVLTQEAEGSTLGLGGSASLYDCIWDYIWLKDNISCWVTFSMTDSSSWSLIFCVSCFRSSGDMDVDVQELFGAGLKYCLIMTPTLATQTFVQQRCWDIDYCVLSQKELHVLCTRRSYHYTPQHSCIPRHLQRLKEKLRDRHQVLTYPKEKHQWIALLLLVMKFELQHL